MNDTVFSPSFGNRPKQLIGRETLMQELLLGLQSPPGSRERAVLLLGQRGYGKTVLLLELAEQARQQGWIVTSPTAVDGSLLENIICKLQDEGEKYPDKEKSHLTGGSIGFMGFSAGLQFTKEVMETRTGSYRLKKLCSAIEKKEKGILILVDEVQGGNEDLRQLILCYQEMVGEGLNVAVCLAGLPHAISTVLNDRVLTFSNRTKKIWAGALRDADIDACYFSSFRSMGLRLDRTLLQRITAETQGAPYLMQLIGHYIIQYAGDFKEADEEIVQLAIEASKEIFMEDVCATSVHGLSKKDIQFMRAMTVENTAASKISDIGKRLQASPDYVQQYKRRLIDSGLITQPARGEVSFTLPYMADYLRLL